MILKESCLSYLVYLSLFVGLSGLLSNEIITFEKKMSPAGAHTIYTKIIPQAGQNTVAKICQLGLHQPPPLYGASLTLIWKNGTEYKAVLSGGMVTPKIKSSSMLTDLDMYQEVAYDGLFLLTFNEELTEFRNVSNIHL